MGISVYWCIVGLYGSIPFKMLVEWKQKRPHLGRAQNAYLQNVSVYVC